MRLRTAALLVILALGVLLAPPAADAQQPGKVWRIGILQAGSLSAHVRVFEAFRQGLHELGYVEGRNISIEYRAAEGRSERLRDLVAELIRLKVDVIVSSSTPAVLAAKQATSTIPIVMAGLADPVASGFVAGLARPGGNITGLTIIAPELSGKRLELLKEIVPGLTRVAALRLRTPGHLAAPSLLRETEVAARSLGLQLQLLEVRHPDEYESAFAAMIRQRAEALVVLPDPTLYGQERQIADLTAKSRLPAVFWRRDFVDAGGLMSYGPNGDDLWRRAVTYVDKILKGARPADLPVEQPTRFELVINLKTAKALGLTIPQSVLFRADKVIQ